MWNINMCVKSNVLIVMILILIIILMKIMIIMKWNNNVWKWKLMKWNKILLM